MSKSNNPQGKGRIPILADLAQGRAAAATVPPKHLDQVSTELFTSLFVLASDFKFKPVPGKSYWLYWTAKKRFWLALIPPQEWSREIYGRCIGECVLQEDMTWTLSLSDEVLEDASLLRLLEQQREELQRRIQNAEKLDDVLPVYESGLPFYQRVFAYALAHSLGASMDKSGIRRMSYAEAEGLLTHGRSE